VKVPKIPLVDEAARVACRARWDDLTKPTGALGRLETLGVDLAGMTGQAIPRFPRKVIFVAAADHGVAAEGVSAYPQAVTAQMAANFLAGGAGINAMARQAGAEGMVVDAGIAGDPPADPRLIRCGVRPGTGNLAAEPAMTRNEAERIIQSGIRIFESVHRSDPVALAGVGEMGIGNTTAAAALTACFSGRPADEVTGIGTGISESRRREKVRLIERALKRHRPSCADPIGALAAVGGLEIGCLAGVMLVAASRRVPVVLDGFITAAAAMIAVALAPGVRNYLIAAHRSAEPGHAALLDRLTLSPFLDLKLRLGEGTGAALVFFLIESAVHCLSEMATFSQAGVANRT